MVTIHSHTHTHEFIYTTYNRTLYYCFHLIPLVKHLVHGLLEGVFLVGSLTDDLKTVPGTFKVHLNVFAEGGVLQNDTCGRCNESSFDNYKSVIQCTHFPRIMMLACSFAQILPCCM